MAWEWSHTAEAYQDAETNLRALPQDTLAIIFAEWHAEGKNGFSNYKHDRAKAKALKLPADIVADAVWEKAAEQATCTNGGWRAWVCPYGCHTVAFECDDSE